MMFRQAVLLLIGIGLIGGLAGCGPGLGSLPPITFPSQPTNILFLITPPSSLAVNAQTTLNAAVTNDSSAAITWSVTCGSVGACGSINPSQIPSGFNTTYTAPPAIPSGTTVTVTATSGSATNKSVSATITIIPPQPIVVSFESVPPASLQVNATAPISAKIVNDVSANPEVKWTVTCGSSACGSFNPTTTTDEAAADYTAPAAVPSGNTVTVTATSMTDPTKSVSANVTITKPAPTLANGTYVFQLSGPVGNGSNFVSGVIVAQNGAIQGGEQDFVSYALNQNVQQGLYLFDSITSGTYTTTPDGNLQITLQTNDFNVGTETINGVIVSNSRVLITEVNGSSIANGIMELQTSKAAPSGGYAFSTFGVDLFGQPAGIGGILNVDSPGGISGTGSVVDINDSSTVFTGQSLAASTVSPPDNFGRVVFQLLPRIPSTFPTFYLAGYIVNSGRICLVETGGDNFDGVMGGTALSQGVNKGNFSDNSIAGSSYVFGADGVGATGLLQVAGVFTAEAGGTLTGTLNWNDLTGKAVQIPISFTGSYTVDPTGRATLANLTDNSTFNYQLQLYLTGNGLGLLLSSDSAEMIAGRALQRQTAAFTAASFSGTYGLRATQVGPNTGLLGSNSALGPVTAAAGNSSDTLTGFADFGNGATDFPVSGSVTASSNGVFTGTVTGLNAASYTTANNFTFYLVDDTRSVLIETDNTLLTLGYLELQQ